MKTLDSSLTVTLFFFSGTGNTLWCATTLQEALEEKGFTVQALSIESITKEEVSSLVATSSLIGIGYPVYGSDLPEIMKTFLQDLPNEEGKEALCFCTQWLWSGNGADEGALLLEQKGYRVLYTDHFLMPNNVCISPLLPYTNDKQRFTSVLKRAKKRIYRLADRVEHKKTFQYGRSLLARGLGSIQRVPFRRSFSRLQAHISFSARCTQCMLCVRLCPVENLYVQEGRIAAGGKCILCLRCYNFCPVSAIVFRGKEYKSKKTPFRGPIVFDPEDLKKRADS